MSLSARVRQIALRIADLVPMRVLAPVEAYARQRRLGERVDNDVVAKVKAKKELTKAALASYEHEPEFAVIVTSFNQVWNVESLATNLLGNPDVSEVVVCEDGSLDGSLDAWVERATGPNHFVVRSNDLHEIRSLDRAFRLSRAKILCIVQDDDVVPTDATWAREVLDLFDRFPRMGVLGGFTAFLEPPRPVAPGEQPDISFVQSELFKRTDFRFVPTVSIGPYYVRAECWSEIGCFDTAFSAPGQAGVGFDEEFGLRCWINGWQVGYLHQPFKTGVEGEYHWGSGGTFMYGEASERTTHDIENKQRIATMYAPHYKQIVSAVEAANQTLAHAGTVTSAFDPIRRLAARHDPNSDRLSWSMGVLTLVSGIA